jgi:hypothetical protein
MQSNSTSSETCRGLGAMLQCGNQALSMTVCVLALLIAAPCADSRSPGLSTHSCYTGYACGYGIRQSHSAWLNIPLSTTTLRWPSAPFLGHSTLSIIYGEGTSVVEQQRLYWRLTHLGGYRAWFFRANQSVTKTHFCLAA